MFDSTGDQIHPATPTRLEQTRRDGKVAKSAELAGAIQLFGGTVVLFVLAGGVASWLLGWTRQSWLNQAESIRVADPVVQMQSLSFLFLTVVAPILVLLLVLGVVSHWIQTGFVFSPQVVTPKLERVSPLRWFRNLFSLSTMGQPFVGFPKTIVCLVVATWMCWLNRELMFSLATMPVDQIVEKLFGFILQVSFSVAVAMLIVSLVDFVMARYSHHQSLKMTDQELRDELRMQNGDPEVQNRRRQFHQEIGGPRHP